MTLRAALIGTYDHVGSFADGAARREDVDFVGAYEPDPERAAGLVEEYGLKIYDSKEELLDANLDIVGAFSPFHEKADDIVACLDRGLHVFADKPAAINPEGLANLRAAVERHPELKLTMALTQRFGPVFNKINELIQEGAVGDVVSITARNSYTLRRKARPEFMFDDGLSGGEWVELATHGVHTVSWLADAEYVAVTAYHGNASSPEEPFQDHGEGLFELANGVNAFIAHDRMVPAAAKGSMLRYEVIGSNGRIVLDRGSGLTLVNDSTEPTTVEPDGGWLPLFGNFMDAILESALLTVPPEEMLHTTAAVLSAYESAQAGGKRVEF